MANYLCISWWNDHDLGDILYQDGFKNKIYLDVEVEKPEYNTTIESDLNGDSVEITKFRKWEKVYRFECWMQEDLVDAFTLMQIHDNIEVTLQSGDVIQVAKHGLRCEPTWEEIGCLAKCVVSFAENYTVAGNCDENKNMTCMCSEIEDDFLYIIAHGSMGGEPNNTIVLSYTVEDEHDKKYTASLHQFTYAASTWVQLANPNQYTCYNNEAGTYWWAVNFTGGLGTIPAEGSKVDQGAGIDAYVNMIGAITGSWALGTAAGTMYLYNKTGVFHVGQVDYTGGHFDILGDLSNYETWFWDGQFWQISPGWINVTSPNPGELYIIGWCLPGAFVNIGYNKVGVGSTWQVESADDLSLGVTIAVSAGDYEVRLRVENHTCDYGYTKVETQTVA
jgi:hypothetical protein